MGLNSSSAFQTLVDAFYFRRVTKVDKVFMTLCNPVQVKTKREENKSKLSPILCQEEVLFDFYVHPECSLEKNMTFGNVQMPLTILRHHFLFPLPHSARGPS